MKRDALLFVALLALTGCENAMFDDSMRKAVREKLKDPDSAKWGEQIIFQDRACLLVNSKNSYGGYTGNQTAWLKQLGPSSWHLDDINEDGCYQHTLEEFVKLDKEEASWEARVVKVLATKGYKIAPGNLTIEAYNSTDKCLKMAEDIMSYHRLARDRKTSSGTTDWLSRRDAELASLENSSDCKK